MLLRTFNELLIKSGLSLFSKGAVTNIHCLNALLPLKRQISSSAMAERPINDFRWGSIWGYYRLNGYFSRHSDMTQFTLTHHMVNKPFLLLGLANEYRSSRRRRWCDQHCGRPWDVYNTDRRTKLTALETISRWLLLKKRTKLLFEPPFRALMGNVCTPSMARWKARGQLYIRRNWTFSLCPTVETLWAEIGRSRRFSKGVGRSLWAQISEGRERRPPTATNRCWCQSKRVIALSRGIKISAVHHLDLSQSTRVTDRRTDRITTPNIKTALAYARAVKTDYKLRNRHCKYTCLLYTSDAADE